MWLCRASGMVFYRAVWPANLGASGAEMLSEKLPSWSGLASGSVVLFILPVFGGGSRDPPACLGESHRLFSSWSKKTKPKQIKEGGSTCLSVAGSLSIYTALLSGRATHTAFFLGSLVSPSLQTHRQGE